MVSGHSRKGYFTFAPMKKMAFLPFCRSLDVPDRRPALAQQGTTVSPLRQPAATAGNTRKQGFCGILFSRPAHDRKEKYTVANTHSHKRLRAIYPSGWPGRRIWFHLKPDIWLQDGRLLVGHNRERSGRAERWKKFMSGRCVLRGKEQWSSFIPDTTRCLQILIDVKSRLRGRPQCSCHST